MTFEKYEYRVVTTSEGDYRPEYKTPDTYSVWQPVEKDRDYAYYAWTSMFRWRAVRKCHQHANDRLRQWQNQQEGPLYLGKLP